MKSVYLPLLLIVTVTQSLFAQPLGRTLRYASVKPGSQYIQTIDASFLKPGDSLLLVFKSEDKPREFFTRKSEALKVLQEFATPKLVEHYDTFQCLQRKVIQNQDAGMDQEGPSRGGGFMDMKGEPMPNGPARGLHEEEYRYKWLKTDEVSGGLAIEAGSSVLLVQLIKGIQESKQVLGFRSALRVIPQEVVFTQQGKKVRLGMQLFLTNNKTPEQIIDSKQFASGLTVPEAVMNWGISWHDSLTGVWQEQDRSILYYRNNVSPMNPDKCNPCLSAPPGWDDWKELGYSGKVPEQLYLSVYYVPEKAIKNLTVREEEDRSPYALVLHVNHPARVFVQCEAYQVYYRELMKRNAKAEANLKSLLFKD